MDDIRASEELMTRFFDAHHELLAKTSQADIFFYEWLEMIEELFDYSPVLLHLPLLYSQTTFCNDKSIEKALEHKLGVEYQAGDFVNGLFLYPLLEDRRNIIGITKSLQEHELTPLLMKYLPFFIEQVNRIDQVSRNLRTLRFQGYLKDTEFEGKEFDEICEETQQFFKNEHLLMYDVVQDRLYFPEASKELETELERPLLDVCRTSAYSRNLYTANDYHPKVKGLILYPLFTSDDLGGYLVSFSNKNPLVTKMDISLICELSIYPDFVNWVESFLKIKTVN